MLQAAVVFTGSVFNGVHYYKNLRNSSVGDIFDAAQISLADAGSSILAGKTLGGPLLSIAVHGFFFILVKKLSSFRNTRIQMTGGTSSVLQSLRNITSIFHKTTGHPSTTVEEEQYLLETIRSE